MRSELHHETRAELLADALEAGNSMSIVAASTSMVPVIRIGTMLRISPERQDLQLGDIVFVRKAGASPYLHRIIEINGSHILTKGDALKVEDMPIERGHVLGKVIEIDSRSLDSKRWCLVNRQIARCSRLSRVSSRLARLLILILFRMGTAVNTQV